MGRLSRKYVKKAGHQIPKHVTRQMRRLHPTVDILWSEQLKRWCLVQTVDGRAHLITTIHDKNRFAMPTLANTVYYLNLCHPSRLRSAIARERFLQKLDENIEHEVIKKNSSDRIREGSNALWNRLTNRLVLPVHK